MNRRLDTLEKMMAGLQDRQKKDARVQGARHSPPTLATEARWYPARGLLSWVVLAYGLPRGEFRVIDGGGWDGEPVASRIWPLETSGYEKRGFDGVYIGGSRAGWQVSADDYRASRYAAALGACDLARWLYKKSSELYAETGEEWRGPVNAETWINWINWIYVSLESIGKFSRPAEPAPHGGIFGPWRGPEHSPSFVAQLGKGCAWPPIGADNGD